MAHRLVIVAELERKRLAGLARKPGCRLSRHIPERPCDWNPEGTASVSNPDFQFTRPGAWAFIAEHLESGADVYATRLDKPPGRLAYVIFIPPTDAWRGLYVKFEVAGPGLYGRSFHHPTHPTLEMEPARTEL
jgi:hypothetical protein